MLRTLVGKVNNLHEQMGNISRDVNSKNQKEMMDAKKYFN